ncbi:hypothetical protein EXVG_00128 [Emiliania huxleyi virus 202]|nr:hypothetical protein EXVG_00128 [Emiliania huxleyi virus 202]AHA54052.1 putative membrane protein [Emiliania huxleyi virus 18]AHA55102.1 putative membrane protein [Emiliania huxleyi virus 156]
MSDTKLPLAKPSMLDKVKNALIENKKILITIVVVGIVLGLVYYFSTQGPTEIDDDYGTTGCPICENADCSTEKGKILVLEQEKRLLEKYKTGAGLRILKLESELNNTEDALKRKTRAFIGSITGLTFATIFAGIGGFFLAKRLYSSESASTTATETDDTG